MTIERVHKTLGIIRRVENLDAKIIEAEEVFQASGNIISFPRIHISSRFEKTPTGERLVEYVYGEARSLDSVAKVHVVIDDFGVYHSRERIWRKNPINKAAFRSTNGRVSFRWKPTVIVEEKTA